MPYQRPPNNGTADGKDQRVCGEQNGSSAEGKRNLGPRTSSTLQVYTHVIKTTVRLKLQRSELQCGKNTITGTRILDVDLLRFPFTQRGRYDHHLCLPSEDVQVQNCSFNLRSSSWEKPKAAFELGPQHTTPHKKTSVSLWKSTPAHLLCPQVQMGAGADLLRADG